MTIAEPMNKPAAASPGLAFTPSETWPAWFQTSQQTAWQDYLAAPAPTRRDQEWRFASLKALDLSSFTVAPEVASEGKLINASVAFGATAAKLVFGNNTLVHEELGELPEGVLVQPLDVAARSSEALFREYFMSQPVELGSHKYAQLHKAMLKGGVLVYVPKNVEVALPIEVFHWVEGANASVFPHTLIVLGDNAKVTVIDHFKSADGARAFACGINDFHLGTGSQLTYVAVQDWSRDTLAFHLNSTLVGRDANSTALIANLGGGYIRGESLSKLAGDGSRSVMLSLNPMDGGRVVDQRTLQDHAAKNASSDLLYRNAMDDKSQAIFSGLIRVEPGNSQTDAYQKVESLMLSEDAVVYSMPGLEILNDDVRCTHGATSGGVSEDELFYMQARGIPEKLARRLVVAGFFNSLLDRVENSELRGKLNALVAERVGVY
jgi:Fe-S cluster assembly protein SufD